LALKDLKLRGVDKLFASVMQLKSGMEHLDEFVATNESTSYLRPFIAHFAKVCVAIEQELTNHHALPDSDRHMAELQSKYDLRRVKRAQNFGKFRKEVKQFIKHHYVGKLHQSEEQLMETK
jgi:hypothetical protein